MTLESFYAGSERRKRISIDVDRDYGHPAFRAQRAYYELKTMFPDCNVFVDKTRKGYHIRVVGEKIAKIPILERIEIREHVGDDPYRCQHDRFKLHLGLPTLVDVLFSLKIYADGSRSYVQPVDLTMLPWVSKFPMKKKSRRFYRQTRLNDT